MSTSPPKNNAALSQLGNLYQYLIALKYCLDSTPGELINIEKYGDLTTDGYNFEIKHHIDDKCYLTGTHIDFWKSVSNWVDNRLLLSGHSKFILLTSAIVKSDSKLAKWNDSNKTDKYQLILNLKHLIESSDYEYKELKKQINNIFGFTMNYNQIDLENVLEKISIKHSFSKADSLYSEILDHHSFKSVKPNQRYPLIRALLGFIMEKGVFTPRDWDIEVSEFDDFFRYTVKQIINGETLCFPDMDRDTVSVQSSTFSKPFIKKIENIPYDEKIQDAALDYTITYKTFTTMSFQNPIFLKKFNTDVEDTGRKLCSIKGSIISDIESVNDKTLIRKSKKLYNDAELKISTGNVPYTIQRGMTHLYVDGSSFQWKIKDDDCED